LIAVSQEIVNLRLADLGERDVPDDLDAHLIARAGDQRSHWQLSYNVGCFYALLSDRRNPEVNRPKAFDWLERCLDRPYSGQLVREWVERDPDLDAIRVGDPTNWQRWSRRVPRMPVQIRPGDLSSTVEDLQRRLNDVASERILEPDGYFGDATGAAIAKFQYENGLPATGLPDLTTLALLESQADGKRRAAAVAVST
jgi:hypothetical protein